MSQDTFFVHRRGANLGPLTAQEIQERVRLGEIATDDQIRVGEQWLPISSWQKPLEPHPAQDATSRAPKFKRLLIVTGATMAVLTLAAIFIVAIRLTQYYMDRQREEANTKRDAKPDVTLNMRQLWEDCSADTKCANLYMDKVVRIRGVFSEVGLGSENDMPGANNRYAVLRSVKPEDNVVVHCYFAVDSSTTESTAPSNAVVDVQGVSFGVRLNESGGGTLVLSFCRIKHISAEGENNERSAQFDKSPDGGSDLPKVQDAVADNAALYSFFNAEVRYWVEYETHRSPTRDDLDMWYGFDFDSYKFFEKACKLLTIRELASKDEFDKKRAFDARSNARQACMKRLSDEAGASPDLARLVLPVVDQKNITWNTDSGTFDLNVAARDRILRTDLRPELSQFSLRDATAEFRISCENPDTLTIRLPQKPDENTGVFNINRARNPVFVLLVQDPGQAKTMKSLLVSSRALQVELLVRVEKYGDMGSSCSVSGGIGLPSGKRNASSHNGRLLAVRLVDGKKPLTSWTSADNKAATPIAASPN